jgi:hypothetical protein
MASRPFVNPDEPLGDGKPVPKIGRPTNYKPEYCQRVLDLGNQGYSLAMIIADIGAGSRQTIENWKKAHPEFLDAITRAHELALAHWERLGLANTGNREFNSNLYRIIMAARFAADGYREKQVIEQQVTPSGVDLSRLTDEEREQLAALIMKIRVPQQPAAQRPPTTTRGLSESEAAAAPPKPAGLRGPIH